MPRQAIRFRDRARDCRALAKGARSEADATMLEDIAAELEAAADKMDGQQRLKKVAKPKPSATAG